MNRNIFVVNCPDGTYGVKTGGAKKNGRKFRTQGEAIKYGKKRAKKEKSELRIQRARGPKRGQFRDGGSYGNDPYLPRG